MRVTAPTPTLLAAALSLAVLAPGFAYGATDGLRTGVGVGWTMGADQFDVFGPPGTRVGGLAPVWKDGPLGTLEVGGNIYGPVGLQAYLAGGRLITTDGVGSGTGLHALLDVTVELLSAPVVVTVGLGGGATSLVAGNMGRDTDMAFAASLGARYRLGSLPLGVRVDGRALATDSIAEDAALAVAGVVSGGVYFIWGGGDGSPEVGTAKPVKVRRAAARHTPVEPTCAAGDPSCSDGDSDGIVDDDDRCPGSAGLPQFGGCPDVDGDGIPDTRDACPSIAGVPEFEGCPDEDRDGLADHEDRCPTDSGEAGRGGCPELSPQLEQLVNRPLQGVSFLPGEAGLQAESLPTLNRVARILRLHEHIYLEVQAHVHSQYDEADAEELTADRATRVVSELVSLGIDPRRMRARGMGATQPIASNRTRRGRTLNERVELRVYTP